MTWDTLSTEAHFAQTFCKTTVLLSGTYPGREKYADDVRNPECWMGPQPNDVPHLDCIMEITTSISLQIY